VPDIQPTHRSSKQIARELLQERNSNRLLELSEELNRVLEKAEQEKLRKMSGLDDTSV
jgi:hypothetical protein